MALRIVTRADLEAAYPGVEIPEDFKPTHWAQVRGSRRIDYVVLDQPNARGISYGSVPGLKDPIFAVIPGGKWQHLEVGGIVDSDIIRYDPNWVPMNERDGHVYFVESGIGGPIKIGWSQDVERRVSELQVANAHKLNLLGVTPGTMKTEGELHARFASFQMDGGDEWFQNCEAIREFIKKNCR